MKHRAEMTRKQAEEYILDSQIVTKDFFNLFCGDFLGYGIGRYVFDYNIDPTKVIKIEMGAGSFQNIYEHQVWDNVKSVKFLSKWFAPIHFISDCGTVVIQSKCQKLPERKIPKIIPVIFSDVKIDNWGLLNDRPVCFDYGYNRLIRNGISKKMKKANFLQEMLIQNN